MYYLYRTACSSQEFSLTVGLMTVTDDTLVFVTVILTVDIGNSSSSTTAMLIHVSAPQLHI